VSTQSSGEALESLGAALRGALARVRASDDLYDVTCGVLRHHLGSEILLSLYEEDAGRVWLRAQRGYAETTNSYPLGDGLISHALREERSIAILSGASADPRCEPLLETVDGVVVSPFFAARRRGAIVLESREPLDATIAEAADDAMRIVEQALSALSASELERSTGSRWLSRSFLRLAGTRDRDALLELTARLVGEVLDVDCVQAAEGADELVVVATWHAGRKTLSGLSGGTVNALAARGAGERFHVRAEADAPPDPLLEGRCEIIGMPMRVGDELLGFLVASSRNPVDTHGEAFEQAELLVAHASTALSTLRMLERSERAAVTDALTGLWNHRRFYETSISLIEAPDMEFALVLADLDDFKELNDRRGHVAGDDALRAVAGVLRRGMRPGDSVFRIGGEEFALLLPSTSRPNARTVCRRLQRTLETLDLGGWRLTLSFGVARSPDDGIDVRTLMQAADAALYEAKRLGKDRITMASERLVARRSPTMKARTRRGFEQMRQLEALVARLGSARTPRAVARELLAGLREVTPGDVSVVWSVEAGALTSHALAGAIVDPAIEQSLRRLGAEALAESRTRLRDDEPGAVPPSALAAPLGSPPLAVVALAAHEGAPFDRDDLRLVEVAARVAGLALANALRVSPISDARGTSSSSLAVALARCDTIEEVGRAACDYTAAKVRADRLSLWRRVDAHRSELIYVTGIDEAAVRRIPLTESLAWREPGDPSVVLIDGPPVVEQPSDVEYTPDTRMAIVPIVVDDALLGSLVVTRVAGPSFRADEVEALEIIAAHLALALHAHRSAELAEAGLLATIESLVSALEIQDPATSRHALAIVELAVAVGRRLGLPPAALRRVEHGAALHDIGKIGVASELLRKQGPLDPQETLAMRCHPELGARILEPVPRLRAVAPIVRASHERYDGNGYPDGLVGDDIPLESRIVAVCDAFDAMVSDRPYRRAMSRDAAVSELRGGSGTQFDPRVVVAFIEELAFVAVEAS
jgi:diguanylate cyclase (GGDEF)-like protein